MNIWHAVLMREICLCNVAVYIFLFTNALAGWRQRQRTMVWVRMRAATIYVIEKKKEERRKWNASKVRCARTHRQCRNWNSILRSPSKNSNVKMWFFCLSLLVCQCHCQSAPLMCGVVAVQAGARVCVCVWAEWAKMQMGALLFAGIGGRPESLASTNIPFCCRFIVFWCASIVWRGDGTCFSRV